MSNRRKLRRYLADGVTPNPHRVTTRTTMPRASASGGPGWREPSGPLRLPAGFVPAAFLPGRRGQR